MRFLVVVTVFSLLGLFNSAKALTVSPVKFELNGDPGLTITSEFSLINEEAEEKSFFISFEKFEAAGESGAPVFYQAKEGLATWISAPAKIILKAGEKRSVPFKIKIPKDVDPGGHFAAIFLSTTPPNNDSGQLAIGGKVGILVLLKVSGEIQEGASLLEFGTNEQQKFFDTLSVTFIYRFKNSGTDRIKPAGQLVIKNIFGLTSFVISANPSEGNVLPQSIRKFEIRWGDNDEVSGFWSKIVYQLKNFTVGWYTASLSLIYNQSEEAGQSFSFFVIPWQLLISVLVIVLLAGWVLTSGVKRYNKWIVKKYSSRV